MKPVEKSKAAKMPTQNMKKVAVIPIFNEEKTLLNVLNGLQSIDFFILINDCSEDNTDSIIREWMNCRENVFYIKLIKKGNMAGALKRGLTFVQYLMERDILEKDDLVINIDADGQHKTEYVNQLISYKNRNKLDILFANRDFSRYPLIRVLGNHILSFWASLLSGFKFNDVESGMRIMSAWTVPEILNYYTGFRYNCAQEIGVIAAMLGYKVGNSFETEIAYYRGRTRVVDLFINLIFGFIAFLRLTLKVKNRAGSRLSVENRLVYEAPLKPKIRKRQE